MKTISVNVCDRLSVNKAITDLQAVKAEWLAKRRQVEEEVARQLAELISENLMAIPSTDDLVNVKTHTEITMFPTLGALAEGNTVRIEGQDIVFVEFGAGVYHNAGKTNPLAESVQFETAIGSYGKGHGNEPYWFVAHNLISRGTPMYMPIHEAIETIKPMIPTIARQVFL